MKSEQNTKGVSSRTAIHLEFRGDIDLFNALEPFAEVISNKVGVKMSRQDIIKRALRLDPEFMEVVQIEKSKT